MTISKRSFDRHEDFDKVRQVLIETYELTKTFQNWIPSMFENTWRGPYGTDILDEEDEYIKRWEAENVGIVAVSG